MGHDGAIPTTMYLINRNRRIALFNFSPSTSTFTQHTVVISWPPEETLFSAPVACENQSPLSTRNLDEHKGEHDMYYLFLNQSREDSILNGDSTLPKYAP